MKIKDQETAKVMSEGVEMERFIKGEGWQRAKRLLTEKMIGIDSLCAIPDEGKTAEEFFLEAQVRKGAVELILSWIAEIEGQAEQSVSHRKVMEQIRKEQLVKYFD